MIVKKKKNRVIEEGFVSLYLFQGVVVVCVLLVFFFFYFIFWVGGVQATRTGFRQLHLGHNYVGQVRYCLLWAHTLMVLFSLKKIKKIKIKLIGKD